ncbi:PSP family protein [Tritrichomonas foetus]|uniref:PSP family protein n=1 Tax=Tritrichomonas foetus TaxID=1144522 RepID=A0A1J4JYH6_9EUKA|nr:PSP family protein [Tritrichomonas foetus]|eukprot:OHT03746.1 PSP family protein [Tritrichomonas foetus]
MENVQDFNPNQQTEVKLSRSQKKRERRKNKKKGIQQLSISEVELVMNSAPIQSFSDDEEYQGILKRFSNNFLNTNVVEEEDQNDEQNQTPKEIHISNQQVKKYGRPTIGMLKSVSRRPELIEPFDTDAPDPFTLAEIKNVRNAIPVPTHWAQKRRYLNYKKGSEITRYRLPLYLEKTGVPQMRQAIIEMEEKRSLAQKQRERARPKTGLFDVSVSVLRDAFFKQQTKPSLTRFGDLYYEGKESMPNSKHIRPGKISQKLREALGMVENQPPPWLFKMQKTGPPPSYPNLRIPGLNAPLPKGAQWGNHIGGWGQVPVDSNGLPLWGGNPFAPPTEDDDDDNAPLWGTLKRSEGVADGVNI